jgi:hypothetical protein
MWIQYESLNFKFNSIHIFIHHPFLTIWYQLQFHMFRFRNTIFFTKQFKFNIIINAFYFKY